MLHKLKLTFFAAGAALLCSCGASKKLESVQGELEAAQNKNAQLQKELSSAQEQLGTAQNQSKALTDQNKALTTEFNNYKAECKKTEDKLNSRQQILEEQYATLQEIEDRIEKAMEEFAQRGVDVYYKDGLV